MQPRAALKVRAIVQVVLRGRLRHLEWAGQPRLGGGQPAFGLYFDCCARGSALFGMAGLEAGYLESTFGATPIAGLFGSCEIGPIGPATELLTYTGVLALVDRA